MVLGLFIPVSVAEVNRDSQTADAVFSLLAERLPAAELEDAKAATPTELRMFWPS